MVTPNAQSQSSVLSGLDLALWETAQEQSSEPFLSSLRRLTSVEPSPVTTWTLIDESFPEGIGGTDRLATIPGVREARWFGEGRVYLRDDHQGAFVFGVAPAQYEGVTHLVSPLSATDKRWTRLQRWVRRTIPGLSPVFLNEDDFLSLGDALAEHGVVEASRLTARDLNDGSSYTRGWPESKRRSRPSHRQALAEAQRLAVRTLTLHVGDRMLVQLRREAGATIYSGDFALFTDAVLNGMALAASNRRKLLSGRERHINAPVPRPLAIRTRGETFGQPEAIIDLLDTLERQQGTGVAVFHRNPYLHAAVTDYSDGSNFDLFINDADELVVVPGYRATVSALARLTDTVGERFSAVEVGEAAPVRSPTMSDLLGDG